MRREGLLARWLDGACATVAPRRLGSVAPGEVCFHSRSTSVYSRLCAGFPGGVTEVMLPLASYCSPRSCAPGRVTALGRPTPSCCLYSMTRVSELAVLLWVTFVRKPLALA